MVILRNAEGIPQSSPELQERLGRIHPNLRLKFLDGTWAIQWMWREDDPRWARVRSFEIGPESAYDIVGYLPIDCSLDQAPGYIERSLKEYPREEVSKLRERMNHWNTVEVPKAQTEEALASSLDSLAQSQKKQNPRRRKIIIP